jgi:adenylosuccinate lyase|tara:strand:+ start:1145 stop:2497 length:1353 start_codon:yes stop_codon:yes gene_type:complete
MKIEQLISPLDNRYNDKIADLATNFSESNLNKVRFEIEIEWLIFLCSKGGKNFPSLSKSNIKDLQTLKNSFDRKSAKRIKSIEIRTNHDVKAVEYFIREELQKISSLKKYEHLVHFALTSEDINSLSYAILMRDAQVIYLKQLNVLIKELNKRARLWSSIPMLARTHGQAASPSTLGKEMKVFVERLRRQQNSLKNMKPLAKFGGATGNYHTLVISDPKLNWTTQTKKFLASFKVEQNPVTTQIEPHDGIAEVAHCIQRINNILIDFNQDIWMYIANDLFKLKQNEGEVGSSTMPHKVNPIDFENSEGNLGLSNAMMEFFANKLTKSRLQRDLSDSTVLRNLGVGFAYSYVGFSSALRGLSKLQPNKAEAINELKDNWQILAEAIQIIMKLEGLDNAYEIIKSKTRGLSLDKDSYAELVENLDISKTAKDKLKKLTPTNYLGDAEKLAKF